MSVAFGQAIVPGLPPATRDTADPE